MARLLSAISLILSLVLFPPAALALVSNNAVPGDVTYPVKRSLEDIIYAVASLNPTTQAWFAKARSNRRFQEVDILITQGKNAGKTLDELVEQTQVAANQIEKISDPKEKAKLISQLSDTITKYDQGLSRISEMTVPTTTILPSSIPSSGFTPNITLTPKPTPKPTSKPTPKPTSKPTLIPSSIPSLIPSPTASPIPSPIPSPSGQSDIDRTRDELEKIKDKLDQQRQRHGAEQENKGKEKNDKRQERQNKEDKDKKDRQDKQDKDKNDDKSSKKDKKNN